jgi:lysophospholipase L1-like esterase
LQADCIAGTGDKRPGARPQFSGVWASMTVKTHANGALDWQRVDSYRCPNCPPMPKAPNLPMMTDPDEPEEPMESTITSSAGEWVISIDGGTGIVIMTDQQVGLGIQKFVTPAAPTCKNDNKGLESASGGQIKTCAALAGYGYDCNHAQYGDTIKSLCPVTCKCAAPACCAQKGAVPAGILVEQTSDPKKILTVGDSWAEYSGNAFADFCDGTIQINKGVGGSSADGWAAGNKFHGRDTNFAKALQAAGTMNGNDVIVLSVGGNDWMGTPPACAGMTPATLQGKVQSAVNALVEAVKATGCGQDCPKIQMFGYAMPTNTAQDGCVATGAATVAPLRNAVANVAAATPEVSFTSITDMCGGSSTFFSPKFPCFGMKYAHDGSNDNIHMNKEGYCMLVTKPESQAALGCKAKTYDCAIQDRDLKRKSRKAAKCTAYPCRAPTTQPATKGACEDNDAGVTKASNNQLHKCSSLTEAGYGCNHIEYGETIKSLCPAMCKCDAPACCAAEVVSFLEVKIQAPADPDDVVPEVTPVASFLV